MLDRPGLFTDISATMGMDEITGGSINSAGCANKQGMYFGIGKYYSAAGEERFLHRYFFQTAPGPLQGFTLANQPCAVEGTDCFPGELYRRFPENASVASLLRNETFPVVLLPNVSNAYPDPRLRVWYKAALSDPNPDPYKIAYSGISWQSSGGNQLTAAGSLLVGFSARLYPSISTFSESNAPQSMVVRSESRSCCHLIAYLCLFRVRVVILCFHARVEVCVCNCTFC